MLAYPLRARTACRSREPVRGPRGGVSERTKRRRKLVFPASYPGRLTRVGAERVELQAHLQRAMAAQDIHLVVL